VGVTVPIPLYEFWRNEVTIVTSYAASPQDIREAIEVIRGRRIRVQEMVTHRLGLAEAGLGFQLVAGSQDSIKVIIDPFK
jgi:L-iditol 2-dehydrogenase